MKRARTPKHLLACLLPVLWVLLLPSPGGGEPKEAKAKTGTQAMVVSSDSLEIDNKQKIVVFAGGVKAERDNITIHCQKMQLHYLDLSGAGDSGETDIEVEKIVASGKVKIERVEGGTATAEQAVYYQKEEKLILTGDPVVRQGEDFVEGEKITLFLGEDRSLVEGSKDSKVRAVISPRTVKQR